MPTKPIVRKRIALSYKEAELIRTELHHAAETYRGSSLNTIIHCKLMDRLTSLMSRFEEDDIDT